jgi:flagellar protein FliL
MALDDKEDAESEEKPKKGNKKMVIIIAIIVLVLVVGGVGAFFAMKGGKGSTEGGTGEEGEAAEESAAGAEGEEGGPLPGAVLPLETFIVNLRIKGSFLKTSVQLEFASPELPPHMESEVPKVRDVIIRILSSKDAAEILTIEGKEKLRQEIMEGVNEALGSELVEKVYFTEFIIQ